MKGKLKRFLFSIFYFSLLAAGFAQSTEATTINITNARQTDYKKDEETGNDLIMLEGDVELSVTKGSTVTKIKAEKVTYDRKTQMLFAKDNVQITTKSDSEGEQFITAGSLIMNTSTLEGVFDGGKVMQTQSDAINLPSGSTLVVFSDIFGKGNNNTIVFKNSSLTFCEDENPHWHIDASRTWLLPGGEFAFFNALLYVGPVPVMYFPAFYYPKDELIFNPVFGYREREGYYFQTTTYLYGRKPLESSSSSSSGESDESLKAIYNFMKSSVLKQQERQGLVLHNLDEDYSGDTTHYIKLMGDWYSNLGGMIGIDGKVLPKKLPFISKLDFNLNLGFSNQIYTAGGYYSPFTTGLEKTKDETYFLGLELPFRYKANLSLTINKPFTINVSLPVYSDPYFSYDFDRRSESMDWFTMLSNFGNEETSTLNAVSSFSWKVASSSSIPLPQNLKPYISSASFSATSLVNISAKNKFYIPSSVVPFSFDFSVSGTLFNYPKKEDTETKITYFEPLQIPSEFSEKKDIIETDDSREKKADDKTDEKDSSLELIFPELKVSSSTYALPSPLTYSLTYSFNPSLVTQISYATDKITKPEEFEWTNTKAWMYTVKAPLNIKSNLSYANNLVSLINTLSYSPVWQRHPSTTGYISESSELNSLLLADYKAESQNIVSTNSLTIKPFILIPKYSSTSITYNSTINMFRKKFTGTAENPEWEYFGPDWTDSDSVTVHKLNFTFATNQMDNKFSQTFVFTSSLYPQLPKFSGTLNLKFPYVSTSFSAGIQQKSKDDSTWIKNPFTQSLNVSLLDSKLNFSQSFSYNLEDNYAESLRFSVSYRQFSAAYLMQRTNRYDFDEGNGWILNASKEFLPYSFSASFTSTSKTYYAWFNRVSFAPALQTSLVADLIRPTNSYFTFSPSINFKINQFLTISFSATSKNSVLYRYFQSALGHDGRVPGEQNIFIDLFNSFRFDNTALRQASGFKLKSLNMTVLHELHDWNFNMTMKIEPRLITRNNLSHYSYSPYLSIGIIWKPMETMKTQITDEYGTWKME